MPEPTLGMDISDLRSYQKYTELPIITVKLMIGKEVKQKSCNEYLSIYLGLSEGSAKKETTQAFENIFRCDNTFYS